MGGSVAVLFQVLLLGPAIGWTTARNMRVLMVEQNRKDLLAITELCVAGKIVPAIDRVFTLEELPEAMRYVGEGRAKGKVVITVPDLV